VTKQNVAAADLVMERASKHRASKIKLFKPDNSKNQAFQA
jgi:hypothetical protein